MPQLDTANFGRIDYQETSAFSFPAGLPGFEGPRSFLPLSYPDSRPLVFLQSLDDPELCFITLPVLAADPAYRLEISPEDLALLGLPARPQPDIGRDVLCLVVLSLRPEGPTANLLAPLVIHLGSHRAVQAIIPTGGYSHQHPLTPQAPPC